MGFGLKASESTTKTLRFTGIGHAPQARECAFEDRFAVALVAGGAGPSGETLSCRTRSEQYPYGGGGGGGCVSEFQVHGPNLQGRRLGAEGLGLAIFASQGGTLPIHSRLSLRGFENYLGFIG